MTEYRINIDKNVLRLLGAQLYGDTPSIIAELVQNAYDADAKNVWITVNIHGQSSIVVQDDGIGMTSDEINDRFLNIGQDRREKYPLSPGGRKVLGRKGIGKLAVFSLAKVIDVASQKNNLFSACRMDFEKITRQNGEPEDIASKVSDDTTLFFKEHMTGTVIVLQQIQKDIARSLNYIVNKLIRTFDVNSENFKIYIRKNNDAFAELSRKELTFTERMDTIVTFGDKFSHMIDEVRANEISGDYKIAKRYENLTTEKQFQIMPYEIDVMDKNGHHVKRNFSFEGWVGTLQDRSSFRSYIDKRYVSEKVTRFEVSLTDNRITVFSRGKVGEFDILPKVQTNRIADAYVIGEIFAEIFEDDELADMAISNRRGYDESDQRYIQLIRVVTNVVAYITRRKEEINSKIKKDKENRGALDVKNRFLERAPQTRKALKEKLSIDEQKHFENELLQFGRAINLTNSTKRIFISHKTECKEFGSFLIRCFELVGMDIKSNIIFSATAELGVPHGQDIYDYLRNCFRDDLYVIFLFSRAFYNSNMCIAETGAAWATNKNYSNVVIDMGFGGIDHPINNAKIGVSLADLEDDELILKIRNLIKSTLESTEFTPIPNDNFIENKIKEALNEYKDRLVPPKYLPHRRYLATPVCPECGSHMKLIYNANEQLVFSCVARKCNCEIEAVIDS